MHFKYFYAKFREILISCSGEIGVFPRTLFVYSVFRTFSTYCACAAFNWVLLVAKKKLRIAGFVASLPFLTFSKRLNPSIHCSIIKKNSRDGGDIEQILVRQSQMCRV